VRESAQPCPPHAFDEPAARAHRRRSLPVVPRHVRLNVRLQLSTGCVEGEVQHTFTAIGDGVAQLDFDAADLTVHRVRRGETPLDFHPHATGLEVVLDPPLKAGESATITLAFNAQPTAGLYFVQGPNGPQAWTQGAMEDHHHWFPCFDAPEHLVTTEVHVEVPVGYVGLSNGEPIYTATPSTEGWHQFGWRHDTPHALYLLTLVVDQLVEVTDRHGPTTLHHWVPAGHEADALALFARVGGMLDFFTQATGQPYPYPRYGHVFLQDFMWGGMENTTLTSLTHRALVPAEAVEQSELERLVAHELAHQWFGDLIAPRGWAEIWLNESFATYFDALCMGALDGPDAFARRLVRNRDSYLDEAKNRYARAVVTRTYAHPYVLFDRHAYEKGSLVLHTLRDQIGHAAFWRGVRTYVKRCAGTAAETPELRRCFEDACGHDLSGFFEDFVYGTAHPKVQVRWRFDRQLGLEIELERTDGGTQTLTVELAWGSTSGTRRQRIRLTAGTATALIPADAPPKWVALDPDQACLIEIDETAEADPALRARLNAATVPRLLRMRTARLLGQRGAGANTRALIHTLENDPSHAVRIEAARALGAHRSAAARDALSACVAGPTHWRVRTEAAHGLGTGAGATHVEALITQLDAETRSYRVRADLLGALGKTEAEAGRAPIERYLSDPAPHGFVTAAALRALAALELPEVADTLLEYAEDPTGGAASRGAAITGLAKIAKLDASDAALKKRLRRSLEALLFVPSFRARYAAVAAIKQLGDKKSIPALTRAHGAESSALLRRSVREALGALDA
jgi:aminopeptidase N